MAIKKGKGEVAYQIGVNLFLLLILSLMVLPLLQVVMQSLTPIDSVRESGTLFIPPWEWSFEAYVQFMGHPAFLTAAKNSFLILFGGVTTSLLLTIPLSYTLSIRNLTGRKFLSGLVLIPFLFNPGLIPNYLLVTSIGLQDTLFAIFVPAAISVYNTFVMKSFFENIPEELKEAARIDGASEFYILRGIIMPLSAPIILTIGLFYGVHFWNEFFTPLMYLNDSQLQPLPVLLRNILLAANINEYVEMDAFSNSSMHSLKAASVILASLPMIIAYPFVQKYFTKGTLSGGVKG